MAIGSENPVKIRALKNVISKVLEDAEIVPVFVPSEVSEQPSSDEEAIRGALNRARGSLEKSGADLGVGIEGCVVETKYGMFVSCWSAVVNKWGEVGVGSGCRVLLPERIASLVRGGKELGAVMDELLGERGVKQDRGAIGVLTKNLITRRDAIEYSIACALARFLSPEYY